ncbi:hypothetical protein LXA43DRAFT_636939 [Ganoderma leucocontextum]|nr:hypothetical protein LXA43DRAFT_636939 [Ganoderma leucocontextum]
MLEFEWGVSASALCFFSAARNDTWHQGDLIRKTFPGDRDSTLARSSLCRRRRPRPTSRCDGMEYLSSTAGLRFCGACRGWRATTTSRTSVSSRAIWTSSRPWARLEVWFKKKSGLKLDWILVWGERFPILTSNHELLRITKDMWGDVCDLIDDMGYGPEFELMWYLDRSLDRYPTCDQSTNATAFLAH